MESKRKILIIIFFIISTPLLRADVGPKPSEHYTIKYEISPVPTLSDYWIFICEDPNCNEFYKMGEKGWGWFECTQFECTSITYGDYFYIILGFEDSTIRKSNTLTKKFFYSKINITVLPDKLQMREIGGLPDPYLTAIICFGIIILLLIVFATRFIIKRNRKIITLPDPTQE